MDPLAQYLESKQAPAPSGDPLEAYLASKPAASAPAPAAPPQLGVGERIGQGLAAVNSTVDSSLVGIPRMLLHGLGKLGVGPAEDAAQGIERYRRDNPRLSMATDLPAYLDGGGEAKAGAEALSTIPSMLSRGVERALPKGEGAVARAGVKTLAGAGSNAAISEANAATSGGKPLDEVGKDIGLSALWGGVLGGGLGGLGALSSKVLDSKGAEARRFIEARGGEVGVGTPGKGPVYDTMDVKGNTSADIGEQSQKSGEKVQKGLDDYKKQVASDPYAREVGKITPKQAADRVNDMGPMLKDLREAARTEQDSTIRAKLQDQIKTIEGTAQVRVGKEWMPYSEAPHAGDPMYSEAELNDLRSAMGSTAKAGESTKASLGPLRESYSKVKAEVDQGPYAPANKVFNEGMTDYEDSLSKYDLKKNTKPGPNAANIKKLAIKGERKGQDTYTAGRERPGADAFSAKHPDLGLELERPELLRKQGELSFNLGEAGSHANLKEVVRHNAAPAVLSLMLQNAGMGKSAWLTMLAHLANKNAMPLNGRVLYNPASAGADIAQNTPLSLLFQAARGGNSQ